MCLMILRKKRVVSKPAVKTKKSLCTKGILNLLEDLESGSVFINLNKMKKKMFFHFIFLLIPWIILLIPNIFIEVESSEISVEPDTGPGVGRKRKSLLKTAEPPDPEPEPPQEIETRYPHFLESKHFN